MKVFISGSISIKKLPKFAVEKIDSIIAKKFTILVGDAKGADSLVQKYLQKKGYENVLVYFAGKKFRNNFGDWKTTQILGNKSEKGRSLYTLKDIEMANDADYGLMIWDGKSEGTLNNVSMMKSKNKRFFVVIEEIVVDEQHVDTILKITEKNQTTEMKQMALF